MVRAADLGTGRRDYNTMNDEIIEPVAPRPGVNRQAVEASNNPLAEPAVRQPGVSRLRDTMVWATDFGTDRRAHDVMTDRGIELVVPQPGLNRQAVANNPFLETAAFHPETGPTGQLDGHSNGGVAQILGPETENVPYTRYMAVSDEVTGAGHAGPGHAEITHELRHGTATARLDGRMELQGQSTGPPPPPPRRITRSMAGRKGGI